MGTTPKYGWPYPELTPDPPDGPAQVKALALAVEGTVAQTAPTFYRPSVVDWSTTGTTYTNVPGMAVPLVANGIYQLDMTLAFYTDQNADTKWRWTYPVGSGVYWNASIHALDYTATNVGGPYFFVASRSTASPSTEFFHGALNSVLTTSQWSMAHFVGATAGTLQLQAAQVVASTPLYVSQGSFIRAFRVA